MKDQHEYIEGNNRYLITAFGASYGIEVMNKLDEFARTQTNPSAAFVKGVILHSVTHNGKAVDEKWFDSHFSRKYKQAMELFAEIMKFNFGEEEDTEEGKEKPTEE